MHPVVSDESHQKSLLSDRLLQSQPSVDLVMCLLDLNLEQALSQGAILRYCVFVCGWVGWWVGLKNAAYWLLSRLGAALSACAQLNRLTGSQRMWSVKQLERLISSPQGGRYLVPAIMGGGRGQQVRRHE